AEIIELLHRGKDYGFTFENLQVDYAVAHKRSRDVSSRLVKGIEFLMKKNDIAVFRGDGEFVSPKAIRVEARDQEHTVEATRFIVATGARPRTLPGLEPDGVRVFTYRQLLEVKSAPKSMLVIGAGPIGMEFAYIFHAYGADVTVLEALPRILPLEDEEVSAEMEKAFKRAGIKTIAGAKVEGSKVGADGVTLTYSTADAAGQTLKADWVLVSVGVQPNTANIGLDKAGVNTDARGFIPVDDAMRTNVPHIYAIGDVTGKLPLAHVASAQGVVAAEKIAAEMGKYSGHVAKLDYNAMPRCVYTHPQVASMGLTEAQAKEKGYTVKVSKFPFRPNGKALGLNSYDGFVKIVADAKYGEILGAHMIGPDVTELLPELVLAKNAELTPDQIAQSVHAHPTLSEVIMEAALGVNGTPISL
ncbi:MAG: dihydrolipoyl dehydrogenase, partial [Candidatus Roseilinea sp.]|uniref:dihydrolipoyl dehydrogenase n=1 Tax=Candidatus Roseilinea sp. TaxID=2838777 RepID=UPI00404BA08F